MTVIYSHYLGHDLQSLPVITVITWAVSNWIMIYTHYLGVLHHECTKNIRKLRHTPGPRTGNV
jgi:hypothetical protein